LYKFLNESKSNKLVKIKTIIRQNHFNSTKDTGAKFIRTFQVGSSSNVDTG
jgi:hypothetical protein